MPVERSLTANAPHSKIVTVLTNKMFHILHFVRKLNSMKVYFHTFFHQFNFLFGGKCVCTYPVFLNFSYFDSVVFSFDSTLCSCS